MRTIFAILTLSMLSLPLARAEDAPAAKTDDATAAIQLKNKSSFTMDASGRNPFWPIGWRPVTYHQTTKEHTGPDILASAFVLSSITLDPGARFAIINGKAMQEGQQFGLQMGNQTYQITVKSIEDGRVILSRRDQEIIVSLRRK